MRHSSAEAETEEKIKKEKVASDKNPTGSFQNVSKVLEGDVKTVKKEIDNLKTEEKIKKGKRNFENVSKVLDGDVNVPEDAKNLKFKHSKPRLTQTPRSSFKVDADKSDVQGKVENLQAHDRTNPDVVAAKTLSDKQIKEAEKKFSTANSDNSVQTVINGLSKDSELDSEQKQRLILQCLREFKTGASDLASLSELKEYVESQIGIANIENKLLIELLSFLMKVSDTIKVCFEKILLF